ncbi:MAG: hypothetical protein KC800_03990 [Candidatus Eremiobacteraeota bacterium]|nr:hypothetical protein [Candidatus Eremiobacteraeota bacterium]
MDSPFLLGLGLALVAILARRRL